MRLFTAILFCLTSLSGKALAQDVDPAPAANASSVDQLIRILEDDQARAELVERLRVAAEAGTPVAVEEPAAPGATTVARQIAEQTRAVAEMISDSVAAVLGFVGELEGFLSQGPQLSRFLAVAGELAILSGTLFFAFLVLRLIARRLQAPAARRASRGGLPARLLLILVATLADLAAVVLAWAIGYAISINLMTPPFGHMAISHTLLLNAFLTVEIVKVVLRLVFEPYAAQLRLVPMTDTTAGYWYFWFARIVSLLGYAFMFVQPVLAEAVGPGLGRAVAVLAMFTAIVVGILVILQNKEAVKSAMNGRVRNGRRDPLSRALAMLGRYWHIIAILYLLAFFVVWVADPRGALTFMLAATLQSLVAVLVGSFVITFVSRFLTGGVRLPEDVRERLPLLEQRLHAFVPRVLQVVRTVVLAAIIIAVAQAWGLINFFGWAASETGQRVTGSALAALLIVLMGFVAYLAMSSWVEYRLNPNFGTVPSAREKTLLSLFRSGFTVALAVFVAMTALAQIGVNIAPLLAGAGVIGLAIGFGAQKFVQDIITGIFIQLENIMNEGDVVDLGGVVGVVEKLTIRSVSIRALDGTLHLLPFSSVDTVANMMKGFSYHIAEIGVAYREDIDEVKEAMQEAFQMLLQTEHGANIIGPLEMHGITAFGDSAINVRARIKTAPGTHWAIGRVYNEFIKKVFDRRGIEIPFPHVTLYMGEDKKGAAPPLNLRAETKEQEPQAGPTPG